MKGFPPSRFLGAKARLQILAKTPKPVAKSLAKADSKLKPVVLKRSKGST